MFISIGVMVDWYFINLRGGRAVFVRKFQNIEKLVNENYFNPWLVEPFNIIPHGNFGFIEKTVSKIS